MPIWKYRAVVIAPATLTIGVLCACLQAGSTGLSQTAPSGAGEDEQTADGAPAESEGVADVSGIFLVQPGQDVDVALTQPLQSVNGNPDPAAAGLYFMEMFARTDATGTVLGVHVSPASPALRKHLKLPPQIGLLVEHVEPGTAAADAELERFDVLYRFDDQLLVNQEQLTALVRMREAGDTVPLTLFRDGDEIELEVVLKTGSITDESLQDLEARTLDPSWLTDHMANPRFQDCRECHEHPFEP